MDIIDNLIFTTLNRTGINKKREEISCDLMDSDSIGYEIGMNDRKSPEFENEKKYFYYSKDVRENFIHLKYPDIIEKAFDKHWYDISDKDIYPANPVKEFTDGTPDITEITNLNELPPYHLIYAYLIENTRIAQIFERLLFLYHSGEEVGITNQFENAYNWLINTEYLFYKYSSTYSLKNISSLLRPDFEANRRNTYYRMFGMDLAFGNSNNPGSLSYNFIKAKASNIQFILLFEQFLTEIWQAYINAMNTSGPNTSDFTNLVDLAEILCELFAARRGNSVRYSTQNLAREEYSACFMMTWFHFIVNYNSPLVTFLQCQGPTSADRLGKIGLKVGIPVHSKCKALFDLAGPAATILKMIENRDSIFHDASSFGELIYSKKIEINDNPYTRMLRSLLNEIILIINNWEKATGHRIKNPEANIRGVVSVSEKLRRNGRPVPVGAM